jgi:hypothetical protein
MTFLLDHLLSTLPDFLWPTLHANFAELKQDSVADGHSDVAQNGTRFSVLPALVRQSLHLSDTVIFGVTNGQSNDVMAIKII